MENEIELSILRGIERPTYGGAPGQAGAAQRRQASRLQKHENLKIMGKTMIITLLLTTMAGLGIIKLQAFALGNDTVKSFLTQFNGGRSMGHRGAPFELQPQHETADRSFFGTVPPGCRLYPLQAHMPPRPPGSNG